MHDGTGIGRQYRRRRTAPTVYVVLVAATAVVGINVLDAVTLPGLRLTEVLTPALWLFICARVALEHWRARTTVTTHGITVRGPLRTRAWAWAEIYGIRVEYTRWGNPRWPAYLFLTDGRRIRLHHFDEQQLDDPIAELDDLSATAVRLGLTSLEWRPEVERRIARGARRRRAWQRAGLVAVAVMLAMFALDLWLIFTDRETHQILLLICVPLLSLPLAFVLLDRLGEFVAGRRGYQGGA